MILKMNKVILKKNRRNDLFFLSHFFEKIGKNLFGCDRYITEGKYNIEKTAERKFSVRFGGQGMERI